MPDKFSYRVFRQGSEVILAVADSVIVGKVFEEGDMRIDVSEEFYHGSECGSKAIIRLIRDATIINAVGENIIGLMIKEKIISREIVLIIDGVPHAQVITMKGE